MAQIREFESTTESYFILDGVSYPKVYEAMYDDIRYSDTKIKLVPTNRDTNQLVFSTQYTNILVDGESFDTALEAISRLNQIVFSKGGGSGGGGTDDLTLEQARLNRNTVDDVILGSAEFNKQGGRKAFAQIADLQDGFIPLTGTEEGKPVTGDIEMQEYTKLWWKNGNYLLSLENIDEYLYLQTNNPITGYFSKFIIDGDTNNFMIETTNPNSVGLVSVRDYSETDPTNKLIYAQRSYVDTKVPKVSTSGVERAYIVNADGSQGTKATSDFKDVLEFADFDAFPTTGETSKIYLALDTNKTYRWSGSAYVQIGGTLETDPIFQASEAASFVAGDKANLDNQSGINSGDETTSSIQTKRPLKTVTNKSLEGTGNIQIDYNDLDNLPVIPTPITNHSGLSLDDGTNPHGTTKGDVGLSNVPNLDTTEAVNNEHTHSNKTILDNTTESFTTALKNAYNNAVSWITTNGTNLINHLSNISNPHNVTKSQVGLSNVPNVDTSTTNNVSEGSNLYFTTARVLGTVLSGLSLATGGEIVSTDSILVAFGKIQKQINNLTTSIGNKLDKVTTNDGIEKVYIKNADGSQGTKATSEFGGGSVDLFPIKYWYQATGAGMGAYGTKVMLFQGTQSDVLGVNSLSYRKIVSAATVGTSIHAKESTINRILPNKGFKFLLRFIIADASTISDVRGFHGLQTTSGFANTEISANTQPMCGIGCDGTDTNIHIFSRKVVTGTLVKIDTGFSKTLNHEYLLTQERLQNSNDVVFTLKNLTTSTEFTSTVVNNSSNLTIVNHRNNNTSTLSCGFEIQRIELNISE